MDNLFDLAATISVQNAGADRALTETQKKVLSLANQFKSLDSTTTLSSLRSRIDNLKTGMADLTAKVQTNKFSLTQHEAATNKAAIGINKMRVGNLAADYDRFSNALSNNSRNAVRAADNFLALFNKTSTGTKTLHETERGAHKLAEGLRVLASSAVVAEGPLGGVASRLRALGAETTELGALGPGGLLVAGFLAAAAAAAVVGVAIFELSKKAAEYGDQINKANIQTGLSLSYLGALKVVAREANTPFEGLTATAARLEVAISKAFTEKGSEAARSLQALKLRTDEFRHASPEVHFQQVAKSINELTNQGDKNRVSQGLLNRGFLETSVALKAVADHMEDATRKANAFGLVMSKEDVEAAVKFEEALADLSLGVEGLGIQVGQRTIPAISAAMSELARALGLNESSWKSWGAYIGNVLAGVVINTAASVAAINQSLSNIKTGFQTGFSQIGRIAEGIGDLVFKPGKITNWGKGDNSAVKQLYNEFNPNVNTDPYNWRGQKTPSQAYDAEYWRMQWSMANSRQPGTAKTGSGGAATFPRGPGGGGGGGGGGDTAAMAKRLADLRLAAVLTELKAEEDANKRSLDRQWQDFNQYSERYNATEERRHAAVVKGLAEEMSAAEKVKGAQQRQIAIQEIKNKQAQEEITHEQKRSKVNDERAKLLDRLNDFLADQTREINYAKAGTDQYDRAIQQLAIDLGKQGVTGAEIEFKLALARTNAETKRAIDLAKELTRERRAIAERPRFAEDKNFPQSIGIEIDTTDATRRRRTTDDLRTQMEGLSRDLTSSLDRAVYDGITGGVKKGLISLTQSLLDMLKNVFLKQMEMELTSMLTRLGSGAAGGGGGFSGFLLKLLGIALPAVAGGLGGSFNLGGGSTYTPGGTGATRPRIVGHAMGLDYVPYDGYLASLHKGERIVPASENRSGGGGNQFHVHYHVDSVEKAGSRDTQRQLAEKTRKWMQHSSLVG